MAHTPPSITVNVMAELDPAALAHSIADAVEEYMALPVCDREHLDEPLAEWERELLHLFTVPRVVKDRSEFRVGQTIALVMGSVNAIALVTAVDGERIEVDGQYRNTRDPQVPLSPPYNNEIRKGYWMILADPEVSR